MPGTNSYTATVSGNQSISPDPLSLGTGMVSIVWNLANSGMSWNSNGIVISQTSSGGTGSTGWGGGTPSLSGSTATGAYKLSFVNAMTGSYSFTYQANVNGGIEPFDPADNPPVIRNEGGGTPWDPDND